MAANSINPVQYGLTGMPGMMGMPNISTTDDIFDGYNRSNSLFGCGYPMGFGGGYNPETYMNWQKQMGMGTLDLQANMEDYTIGRGVSRQHKLNASKFALTGAENAMTRESATLGRVIGKNNQDYVQDHYEKLVTLAKQQLREGGCPNPNPTQVQAYIEDFYASAHNGRGLIEDLEENGNSEFVFGIKKGLDPFNVFTNDKSAKENISYITGEEITPGDKAMKVAGQVVGTLGIPLMILGAVIATPLLLKGGVKGAWEGLKLTGTSWKSLFNWKTAAKTAKAVTP